MMRMRLQLSSVPTGQIDEAQQCGLSADVDLMLQMSSDLKAIMGQMVVRVITI